MNYQGAKHLEDENVETIIERAIKKVNGERENDLCKYLPMDCTGYMHHFTLRKMKLKQPKELMSLIENFIINAEKPLEVSPKKRAPRGSKQRKDQLNLTKNQIDRLLNMSLILGDKEIINVLSPKKSLTTCKKELMQSIRQGVVNEALWNSYVEGTKFPSENQEMHRQMINNQAQLATLN